MVRHEAAVAVGSIGGPHSMDVLNGFLNVEEPVISESCKVAIGLFDSVGSHKIENSDS